jgi:hypothetical protein
MLRARGRPRPTPSALRATFELKDTAEEEEEDLGGFIFAELPRLLSLFFVFFFSTAGSVRQMAEAARNAAREAGEEERGGSLPKGDAR